MARVVLESLTKVFIGARGEEILAVNHLHLTVEDKELLVLVGPSGCGKSTTLRLIAGLEKATRGVVSIDGRVVNDVEPKDRDLAMVFQNHALYPHLTVYDNLALGLKLRKVPRDQIERRVREAAEILGLAACLDRLPAALSGGQRQCVAVGRAIVRQPKVFLFDEPLSNLDAPLRAQMRVELSKLHQRLGVTMIYVTHDQVEAMTLGDRIAAMDAGVIQQIGDPGSLYDRPANLFVAGFIGSPPMNRFHGSITRRDGSLFFEEEVLGAERRPFRVGVTDRMAEKLVSFIGRTVVMGLRPEAIADGAETGGAAAEPRVEARLEVVEPMCPETYLHLTTGAHTLVARSRSDRRGGINRRLQLVFDMSQAHFFDPATGAAIG